MENENEEDKNNIKDVKVENNKKNVPKYNKIQRKTKE